MLLFFRPAPAYYIDFPFPLPLIERKNTNIERRGNGLATAIIHMTLMGIPPLALAGQVFGALLSGILYRTSKGKLIFATLGEIIGTGILSEIQVKLGGKSYEKQS